MKAALVTLATPGIWQCTADSIGGSAALEAPTSQRAIRRLDMDGEGSCPSNDSDGKPDNSDADLVKRGS